MYITQRAQWGILSCLFRFPWFVPPGSGCGRALRFEQIFQGQRIEHPFEPLSEFRPSLLGGADNGQLAVGTGAEAPHEIEGFVEGLEQLAKGDISGVPRERVPAPSPLFRSDQPSLPHSMEDLFHKREGKGVAMGNGSGGDGALGRRLGELKGGDQPVARFFRELHALFLNGVLSRGRPGSASPMRPPLWRSVRVSPAEQGGSLFLFG